MVERLKAAIEKARQRRDMPEQPIRAPVSGGGDGDRPGAGDEAAWEALPELALDPARLAERRVVSWRRTDPAHLAFDILRTRLLKLCADRGWRRIGVTSPTKSCGKTMVAANLSVSLARQAATRVILLDLDLRRPALAHTLGTSATQDAGDFLAGRIEPQRFLARVDERLAVGLTAGRSPDPAETLQSAGAAAALSALVTTYRPTVMLVDLPPMLVSDDALAAMPMLDAVLLVAGAGQTTAAHLRDCDRLLADGAPLIGVVLNKCEDEEPESYDYGYGAS